MLSKEIELTLADIEGVRLLTGLPLSFSSEPHENKIKLATAEFKDIDIIDPFRFNDDKYLKVMDDIKFLSKNMNLNFF